MGQLIAAAAYRGGQRIMDISIEEGRTWAQRPGHFVWIGFHEPNEAELREIQAQFGLHPLAVEDAQHGHQRPKVEDYGDSLFVVLHLLERGEDGLRVGEVDVFAGPNYILTIPATRSGASSPCASAARASRSS